MVQKFSIELSMVEEVDKTSKLGQQPWEVGA
jgi:hypothetical protein